MTTRRLIKHIITENKERTMEEVYSVDGENWVDLEDIHNLVDSDNLEVVYAGEKQSIIKQVK